MTQAEAPAAQKKVAALRPRNAATLLVLRRDPDATRVLMGRRSARHAFHPDKIAFPGGRVDRGDYKAPAIGDLHADILTKLAIRSPKASLSRALALTAVRETYEEVGVLVGAPANGHAFASADKDWSAFLSHGVVPNLSPLRLIARAITPPGGNRRYDARFFAVFDSEVVATVKPPSDELQSPAWLTFDEVRAHELPRMTRIVIDSVEARLKTDPELSPATAVPFHFVRNGKRQQLPL